MKKPKTITKGTDSRALPRGLDALLTTAQLSDRWGGKSPMTFWRYDATRALISLNPSALNVASTGVSVKSRSSRQRKQPRTGEVAVIRIRQQQSAN